MTPAEQARVLLAMILCGAALGAAYDGLGLLEKTALRGRFWRGALDMMFGVLLAAGMTAAGLLLRTSVLRGYTLAGAAIGAAVYRASLGTFFRKAYGGVRLLGRKLAKK